MTLNPWTMAALQDANQQRESGARESRPVASGSIVPTNTFQGGIGPVGHAGEPQQLLQVQFGLLSPDGLPTQPALQDQTVWQQQQQQGTAGPGPLVVPQ